MALYGSVRVMLLCGHLQGCNVCYIGKAIRNFSAHVHYTEQLSDTPAHIFRH